MIGGLTRFTRGVVGDLADAIRREKAYFRSVPQSALLFLTYRCTSRCRTCTMWSRKWNLKDELSLDEWKRATAILIANGIRVMELFGGDVLLRKDALLPLIRYLKGNGVVVHIPTNCNLLDRETAKGLIESQVDYLYISVDGVESAHDAVRGVENTFHRMEAAMRELTTYRTNESPTTFVCNTTVSKYNVDSLEEIAHFAAEAGFDEIHFEYVGEMTRADVERSLIDGIRPTPYFMRGEDSSLISLSQAKRLRKSLKSIRHEFLGTPFGVRTINTDFLSDNNLIEGSVPEGKCYAERCEVTVDPGGNVVACPFFHDFRYGNLLEDDFRDIWHGTRHTRFDGQRRTRRLPLCRHCILSVERNHSFPTRIERIGLRRARAVRKKLARLRTEDEGGNE